MKRIFRFSLLALMAVVTLFAVVLAYVSYYRLRSVRFESVRSELQASGGALTLRSELEEEPGLPAEPHWTEGLLGPNAYAELDEVTLFLNQPRPGLVSRVISFDSPVCLNAYGKGIGDEDAAAIGRSAIEELDLDSTSLTVDGYAAIAKAQRLSHLALVGGEITAEHLAPLAHSSSLKKLTLIDAEMTSEIVAAIADMAAVRELFLYQTRWADAGAWQAIGELAHLQTLRITSSKTPTDVAPPLHKMTNLERLAIDHGELASFDGVRVSPQLVEALATAETLEALDIGLMKCEPPLEAWPAMDKLTNLTQLSLLKVRGIQDFSAIATASSLKSLAIGEGFDDASLAELAKLSKLTHLSAGSAAITDAGIDDLAKIKTLREVTLGPQVTQEGAKRLKGALPKCKITLVNGSGKETAMF
ncbi:leucine-rich repeat domain-containing protein [Blastopirellula retiformator]|uniref:Leucine Rich repeats (2 copies) n=1 Tax=Blastopirellula retiformator TaxID=2527970 RepID=A0A5C5VP36_9BACT|nr:leucine-rich repeat domain-containing protein [Blastopirellula retiformator]TWT39479.1 Leucine Rich repeats (2 copies) [Blastopirellula retiformator]